MFRVDRIDALIELDEPAAPPPQAVPHRPQRRRLPARPRTCRWSPCGWAGAAGGSPSTTRARRSRRDGDEWLVSLRVTDLGWARRLLLGLGPDVTVVGPPELVERIRAQATAALDQYAAPPRASRHATLG